MLFLRSDDIIRSLEDYVLTISLDLTKFSEVRKAGDQPINIPGSAIQRLFFRGFDPTLRFFFLSLHKKKIIIEFPAAATGSSLSVTESTPASTRVDGV